MRSRVFLLFPTIGPYTFLLLESPNAYDLQRISFFVFLAGYSASPKAFVFCILAGYSAFVGRGDSTALDFRLALHFLLHFVLSLICCILIRHGLEFAANPRILALDRDVWQRFADRFVRVDSESVNGEFIRRFAGGARGKADKA